jgi:CO dehydrogenase maturation factor
MKIAVAGKGGSGKTTVSGTLARTFAADGVDVLALDDDDDPNLSVALGMPRDEDGLPLPDELVNRADSSEDDFPYELTSRPRTIIDDYGIIAPDGVTLLEAGEVEAGSGCFGMSHVTVRMILSSVEEDPGDVTIVDMPNGIEHLGLATAEDVDVMVVVVEPYYKSLETARKIAPLVEELDIPELRVVANKIRTDDDRETVEEYCANHDLDIAAVIPFDDPIRHAELDGSAPIDYDSDSPAVGAIRELAGDLVELNSQR